MEVRQEKFPSGQVKGIVREESTDTSSSKRLLWDSVIHQGRRKEAEYSTI